MAPLRLLARAIRAAAILLLAAAPAAAQSLPLATSRTTAPTSDPVAFTADAVEYDRDNALVTASGRVEAWQNDRILRADKVVFDRNTGVAAATGNVVLLEPDGQVLFADYAEMAKNMREGFLSGIRAQLAENGRMAANGARRTDGAINEMARVVYSTCDACAKDPSRPLLWQVKAASALHDAERKTIEYRDASLEFMGVPVAYVPYFFHPDPSVKRASGLLPPAAGASSRLGAFYSQPYFWVIDDQSDATFVPSITTRSGGDLNVEYRRRFDSGFLTINPSLGTIRGKAEGAIGAKGQFALSDAWRWGFDINRASSVDYLLNFRRASSLAGGLNLLTSQIFAEGFGQGSYARVDAKVYQSMNRNVPSSRLPLALPRVQYSYFGLPDSLGGRTSVDFGAFNVVRTDGTNTRRMSLSTQWQRPFVGALGDLWKATLRNDAVGYDATHLNEQPTYGRLGRVDAGRSMPQAAVDFRWPFMRDAGAWGTQLIEPMAQVVVAPRAGDSQRMRYPNEDSLDFEFSDANLFGFNRFPGLDRMEGGVRANVALHGAWYLNGTAFDGIVGQSYKTARDPLFPAESGLRDKVSDVVARGSFSPAKWLDLTYRTRLDKNTLSARMIEATASVGARELRATGGYFYSATNSYGYYDVPAPPPAGSTYYRSRNELVAGVSSDLGPVRFQGFARRDFATNRMVAFGADIVYEDECFVLDLRVYRRNTSVNNDGGATTVLLLFTFKTIGDFGYRAF